jgi:hypothetical protein
MKLLDQAFEATRTFRPMSQQAVAALLSRTAKFASKGKYERFKTTDKYDTTAKNPQYLS